MGDFDKPPGYALLEARHVDNLTAAARSLSANIVKSEALFREILVELKNIAQNTADIPALLRVLTAKATNGDAEALAEKETEQ